MKKCHILRNTREHEKIYLVENEGMLLENEELCRENFILWGTTESMNRQKEHIEKGMLSRWAGELPYRDLLRSAQRSLPRLCCGMLVRNERRRDLRTPDRSRRHFVLRYAMRVAQRAGRLADHYQCAKRQDDLALRQLHAQSPDRHVFVRLRRTITLDCRLEDRNVNVVHKKNIPNN